MNYKLEDLLRNKIAYENISDGKSKEVINFARIAYFLSKYGFECIKVSSDKHGADMLAYHIEKSKTIQIQIKGRPVLRNDYKDKCLYICYISQKEKKICFYEHNEALKLFEKSKSAKTKSWLENGKYSWPNGNTPFDSLIYKYTLDD